MLLSLSLVEKSLHFDLRQGAGGKPSRAMEAFPVSCHLSPFCSKLLPNSEGTLRKETAKIDTMVALWVNPTSHLTSYNFSVHHYLQEVWQTISFYLGKLYIYHS